VHASFGGPQNPLFQENKLRKNNLSETASSAGSLLVRAKREIVRIWGELRSLETSATGDAWERAQNAGGAQERGLQRLVGDEEISETLYIRPLTRSFFSINFLSFLL